MQCNVFHGVILPVLIQLVSVLFLQFSIQQVITQFSQQKLGVEYENFCIILGVSKFAI